MRLRLLLPLLLSLSACHAKFKKYAPTLGSVKVQVLTTGGPYVHLGQVDNSNGSVVGGIVNVVQAVKSVDLIPRIEGAVQIPQVNGALQDGLITTLGGGPPFGSAPDAAPLLQLEVESYGLNVPYLGAPGQFTYTALATVYTGDGKRIYHHRLTCSTGVGDPSTAAVVLGTVNNVRQIDKMTDAEINQAFVDTARWCGQLFVTQMRKHAG